MAEKKGGSPRLGAGENKKAGLPQFRGGKKEDP